MEYVFLFLSMLAGAATNALGLVRRGPAGGVVIFKLDHIGDLVTAGPAIAAIRAERPGEEVTLVVGSWCAELAHALAGVDRVVTYDSPAFARDTAGRSRRLGEALGARRFVAAYGLRDDAASMLYCLAGGALRRRDRGTVRVAHRIRRSLARLFGRGDPGPLHEVETNLRVAGRRSGADLPVPRLRVPEEASSSVEETVEALRGPGKRRLVVVHPGAAWEFRRWSAPRFAELVARLVQEGGVSIAVTGSSDERGVAESVAVPGPHCRVLAGDLSLLETAALVSAADCYVGADTGIMHMAVAVSTPVVALFGPQDPRRFGPVGPRDVVIRHPVACAPCRQRTCPRDGECMRKIGVDEVADAVNRVLSGEAG